MKTLSLLSGLLITIIYGAISLFTVWLWLWFLLCKVAALIFLYQLSTFFLSFSFLFIFRSIVCHMLIFTITWPVVSIQTVRTEEYAQGVPDAPSMYSTGESPPLVW